MKILCTGGAGFIGSHLVDALIGQGHDVWVADSLNHDVHRMTLNEKEAFRIPGAYFRWKSSSLAVKDDSKVNATPYDVVFHLAAVVGVGQSQYEIDRYITQNVSDTAQMLQVWVDNPEQRPKRLIVASSMSIYGEGDRFEGISETEYPTLPNQYALTKYAQEIACLNWGRAFDVPTTALRFFNVYGDRQSLSNPYTGIAAIFAACLLSGRGGLVFEDGRQTRDFVHVSDIVQGVLLAMTAPAEVIHGEAFNIGTGKPTSLLELHGLIAAFLKSDAAPIVTGQKRKGDIRHCFASIEKAKRLLGYIPRVELCEGIERYADWLRTQDVSQVLERVDTATAELKAKGLLQ
jgi:dTDP-L-rhamnose 4-epimerase